MCVSILDRREGNSSDCGEDIPPQMAFVELLMSTTKLVAVSWPTIYYSDVLELDDRCEWNMKDMYTMIEPKTNYIVGYKI